MSIKKIAVGVFLFFLALSLYRLYSKKEYDIAYYPDRSIMYKVPLKNGERNGLMKQYYEDGSLELESNWVNGLKNGKSITYHQNGKVKYIVNFKEGLLDGFATVFDSTGILIDSTNYLQGEKSGLAKEFYSNGKLKIEAEFSNGMQDGIVLSYYPTGELMAYHYFVDDSLWYYKTYNGKGDVVEEKLPLKIERVDDLTNIKKSESIKLKVELLHSICDDLSIAVEIKNQCGDSTSVISKGNKVVYEEIACRKGENTLQGKLFELEGDKKAIMGIQPFEYKYFVE